MVLTHHGINSLQVGNPSTVRIGEHDYPVVRISSQLWTAENLFEDSEMSSWYNNDESTARANKYGKLYRLGDHDNTDPLKYIRGILNGLPSGWRLPSQTDWRDLGAFIYNNYSHSNVSNYLLKDYGDLFGFGGVLCGFRNKDGEYVQAGVSFPAWTSSPASDNTGKWIYNAILKPNRDIDTFTYSRNSSSCALRFVSDV